MGKIKPGNKQNAGINGEWGKHVRKRTGDKQITSGKRRARIKIDNDKRLDDETFDSDFEHPEDDMN